MFRKIRFFIQWLAGSFEPGLSDLSPDQRRGLGRDLIQSGKAGGNPFDVALGKGVPKRRKGFLNFDALVILVIGTVMTSAVAVAFLLNAETVPASPVTVTGEVLRLEPTTKSAKPRYYRIIGYETPKGEALEIRDPMPSKFKYALGKSIGVTYNANDPEDAVVTGSVAFWLNWVVASVGSLLALFFGASLLGNLSVMLVGWRLRK